MSLISRACGAALAALVLTLSLVAPRAAVAAVKDPCSLLTASEASATLGGTVGKPKFVKGEDNLECDYASPKISATVTVSAGEAFCLSMSKGSATKPFPQVAPGAAYVFNVGTMFVPKHGTCAAITLESTSQDLSGSTKAVPPAIVTIASKVAARL